MTLIWKLLRQHISPGQLVGYTLANLMGMLIVMLSLQFYTDVKPVFTASDGVIGDDYLVISKRIGAIATSSSSAFTEAEISDLQAQPFATAVGAFTASQCRVACTMGAEGMPTMSTEMYFESVPDAFVDTDHTQWTYTPGADVVPIILPRAYLAIYNFGFAQSRSLPKLTEGVASMVDLLIVMRGNGTEGRVRGKIVGFSSRLNTILVPEAFAQWSNEQYAPGADAAPTRLIVKVSNPADDAIARYIGDQGWQVDDDKLSAGRVTYFLRLLTGLVMGIGLIISALSFFILTLSIYLLVQKNTQKLHNLLLIGYSPSQVSRPYQALTVCINVGVFALACISLWLLRGMYMDMLWSVYPTLPEGTMVLSLGVGCALCFGVSLFNCLAVRRKVYNIWRLKA